MVFKFCLEISNSLRLHFFFNSRNHSSVTKIKHLSIIHLPSVMPAKAGIHAERILFNWIPAFAGMTIGIELLHFDFFQLPMFYFGYT